MPDHTLSLLVILLDIAVRWQSILLKILVFPSFHIIQANMEKYLGKGVVQATTLGRLVQSREPSTQNLPNHANESP